MGGEMTMSDGAPTQDRGVARIGALVPFTNVNMEPDLQRLRPNGVSVHTARLGGYDMDAVPDSTQMAGLGVADLDEPLALIAGVKPDVVLYGCTSATLAHGAAFDDALARTIERRTGAEAVTAAGAIVGALEALGARRISFASPYTAELNDRAIAFLDEHAIETVRRADYAVALDNYGQGALQPEEIIDFALRADSVEADALVLVLHRYARSRMRNGPGAPRWKTGGDVEPGDDVSDAGPARDRGRPSSLWAAVRASFECTPVRRAMRDEHRSGRRRAGPSGARPKIRPFPVAAKSGNV